MSEIDYCGHQTQRLTKTEREILNTEVASTARAHALEGTLD